MHSFTRGLSLILSLLYASIYAAAQTAPTAPGLITGRVTIDGKALPEVELVLLPEEGEKRTAVTKAPTDVEGRFRLTTEYAGRYRVVPVSPGFISSKPESGTLGKSIAISPGEEVAGVDLSLTRGGIITGQVKTPDGLPAIAEHVTVTPVGEREQDRAPLFQTAAMFETDDRGVYRVFGLAPGRYIVSAGSSNEATPVALAGRRASYARTYYLDATEESKAAVIEVSAGAQASNIDINLSRRTRSFAATGRVVDEKTNQPLADIALGYLALRTKERIGGVAVHGFRSDSKGEFKMEGLLPGSYIVFIALENESNSYGDNLSFDVPTDEDVSGLEIKAHQASSVSGTVVVENTKDPGIIGQLPGLPTMNFLYQTEMLWTAPKPSRINSDGTFRLSGPRPGKLRIATNRQGLPRGFSIERVELDGVGQGDGIEIQPETNIMGYVSSWLMAMELCAAR